VAGDGEVDAAAALYAAAQLEELGVLRVCDRLVELYLRGGLPVGGTGEAATLLDGYWLGRAKRLPEDERRELFARVVGPSFEHLLGRLAAAIAADDDDATGWAAGELEASIDRHVDDDALAAAGLLRAQLGAALRILSDAELLDAYGVRDPWELTDHLSRLELGETRDIARHQTLSATGAVLVGWLASDGRPVTDVGADAARTWLATAPDA